MIVIKRDGTKEEFSIEKVISAVNKSFESVNQVTATIEDMGFGEFFPSSGKGWRKTITV